MTCLKFNYDQQNVISLSNPYYSKKFLPLILKQYL